ncbi:ATP-binding protein [Paeniglutamicibacter antarcticus]|uniref:ATP-binding protein n=1 Tax=Arthrobacter terrae TaxID=2935737 RepID=A0A931G755_9MICC|nr:ATP-binding protein [Arthrobacter terrae]MBG0741400.1 ATP-binding protein [Arthrobacter terrae]
MTQVALQLEGLLKDDGNDSRTPEDLFLTAVDGALEIRRANRIDKLIGKARFPIPHASIEEIRYLPGRGVTSVRMQRYAAHDWGVDPTNLLLISPTGAGKTYIACAIGIAACHAEHTVHYTRMDEPALSASPIRRTPDHLSAPPVRLMLLRSPRSCSYLPRPLRLFPADCYPCRGRRTTRAAFLSRCCSRS